MRAHTPGELHSLFRSSFNAGDVEALVSLYEPDAVLIVGGMQVVGHDNIRAALGSMIAAGGRMSVTTRTVLDSSDGLALLHGEWIVDRTADETTRGISTERLFASNRTGRGASRSTIRARWLFVRSD